MAKFVRLRGKAYLIDEEREDIKKTKGTKKCVINRKFKFENYQNRLEANQIENKIYRLEKNRIDIDRIKENCKGFIWNNKSMVKVKIIMFWWRHQLLSLRLLSLISNDDKRIPWIDSIETYAYGTIKDLLREKEEIKCSSITK